jgi:hypothetical protein
VPTHVAAQFKSDWERQQERREWKEVEAKPPAFPQRGNLIEFDVSAASDFRFFVDSRSLSIGPDGVVRYVLVARSPSGAENVSFEGIRCATGEVKIYATGRPDGSWEGRASEWRTIEPRTVQRWHNALQREYFCPTREPIRSAQEGVDALRRGGNPEARAPHLR